MSAPGEFAGTSRFEILRRIGAGGMGVVYEARDRERGQTVALKTLRRTDYDTLYRFKREFRALADLSHPNLASLYDLFVEPRACFFTMELVEGEDLLSYVAPGRPRELDKLAYARTLTADGGTPAMDAQPIASDPVPCDERRLRALLPQLGLGLAALHAAGKIHRDIKPSNVLITPSGRVVLLDFGLVAEVDDHADSDRIVGTVGYMAPEQAAGGRLTPAADWYAVGVVLYQALTGRLPFWGPELRVLVDKQQQPPPSPRTIVPSVPDDLESLCLELLQPDPARRLAGDAVLRRLGVSVSRPHLISRDTPFAGRDAELGRLMACLSPLAEGRASAAVVRGASGMGKSALVSRFLDRVRAQKPGAVILTGRCYEREAIPYKAMDSLIDHLSNHGLHLPQAMLPDDAAFLPTLFPVLGRVPAIAEAPRPAQFPADRQELRTRAFAALRQVLQRMAARAPLVLFLDDMQWVDADTLALLADLMRPPDPPALLLLLTTRAEGESGVLELLARTDTHKDIIDVGPLGEAAALELALRELGEDRVLAERIAREAGGSPFFLLELVRYMQERDRAQIEGKGLDAVLSERIGELGEAARALAEVIATAGEPLPLRAAGQAAGLAPDDVRRQIDLLRTQRFVRASARAEGEIEPYHDRVREAILAGLPAERRKSHHRGIAIALTEHASAERIARHWHGAGDAERAAQWAHKAADQAIATLDFDRAANLYRMALDLGTYDREKRRTLRTALGQALSNAGRPLEASEQFGLAAADSEAAGALELRRRTADALLRGGYLEAGLEATRRVLSEVGLRLSRSPARALLSALVRRAWLRIRGLGWKPRRADTIPQKELTRVDVQEGVAMGLVMVDVFSSLEFSSRFLLSALRLGEPRRVGRALALEADLLATQGNARRAKLLCRQLELLTAQDSTPKTRTQLMVTQGMIAFLCEGRWREALAILDEAAAIFRAHEAAAGFELDTVAMFCLWALYYLGDLPELCRRVPALVEAAQRGGVRYAAVNLRAAFPAVWLARDQPEQAEREIDAAMAAWPADGYHIQHLFALVSRADIALYRGEPAEAAERVRAEWPALRRSLLHLAPSNQLLLYPALARLAVARGDRAAARRWLRRMARAKHPILRDAGRLFGAALAEREQAIAILRDGIARLESYETHLVAQAARRRLDMLTGDDAAVAAADAWFAERGVRDPGKMAAMLLPWPR